VSSTTHGGGAHPVRKRIAIKLKPSSKAQAGKEKTASRNKSRQKQTVHCGDQNVRMELDGTSWSFSISFDKLNHCGTFT